MTKSSLLDRVLTRGLRILPAGAALDPMVVDAFLARYRWRVRIVFRRGGEPALHLYRGKLPAGRQRFGLRRVREATISVPDTLIGAPRAELLRYLAELVETDGDAGRTVRRALTLTEIDQLAELVYCGTFRGSSMKPRRRPKRKGS